MKTDKNKKNNQSIEKTPIFMIPSFKEEILKSCENLKLTLDKYLKYQLNKDRVELYKDTIKDLKESVFNNMKNYNKTVCNEYVKKLNQIQSLITSEKIQLTTDSRLVIGLGITSVLEVSMRLHHIYGIPYIPSSTVKGILRSYNLLKISGGDSKKYEETEKKLESLKVDSNEKITEEDKEIFNLVKLFGNQNYKGDLIILDAYPDSCPEFEEDIINVHYPDYYQENKPPSENQNPSPIKFLTIKRGTKFNFYFKNSQSYKELTGRDIKEDLIQATKYIGIGSKTSIGYGMLK